MNDQTSLYLRRGRRVLMASSVLALLAACEDLDFDLRGATGGFSTTNAAQNATARPAPDARGIITFPTYQVAVAQRGDTVQDVANRIGYNAARLASFNGLPLDTPLRDGELIALPEPLSGAAAPGVGNSQVDVTALAGAAIDNAPDTTPNATQNANEPIRHKVARGETAFSIARLYGVSVRSLARWNSLGPQFAVREGQFLLIPVAGATPPATTAPAVATTTIPGEGTPTPTPPAAAQKPEPKPEVDVGAQTKPAASNARFALPVQGTIIRDYAKGRNEGINIQGAPGAVVKAAGTGTVAAITESSDGVPIIVVRHDGNLLTVYANVTDVLVQKGDTVRRGQGLAKLRPGDQSFVHFEVREGFDSVDPNTYLN